MNISMFDIFSIELYQQMLSEGYIRIKQHPTLPLRIIEYTEKTVYSDMWNPVTKACRGLIVDNNSMVIARPFDKFMNYNPEVDSYLLDEEVIVLDKLDGSLGILYIYDYTFAIATKGSFISDQATHATKVLLDKYVDFLADRMDYAYTYLFEIIYPENRIVCDYADMDDLVLLGARSIASGQESLPNGLPEWFGPSTTIFPYKSLRDALQSLPRPNAEGFVCFFPKTGERRKVKYEEYLRIHRIISDLTPRRIWASMKDRKNLQEILAPIPDEWHEWTKNICKNLTKDWLRTMSQVNTDYQEVLTSLGDSWTRKDFALVAKNMKYSGLLFNILDGRDIKDSIWDMVRPD